MSDGSRTAGATTGRENPFATPSGRPWREDGYVDFFGYANAAGGWLFCGWCRYLGAPPAQPLQVVAYFQNGVVEGEALVTTYERQDLDGQGLGVVVMMPGPGRILGEFAGLAIRFAPGAEPLLVQTVRPVEYLRETDLVPRARAAIMGSSGEARGRILALLSRQIFAGVDTLEQLTAPVLLEFDETVAVPPDGLVLVGWLLDPTGAVACIRIRSSNLASAPLSQHWLKTSRPDVVESAGTKYGLTNDRCGFIALAMDCVMPGEVIYAEIELHNGEVAYRRVPRPLRRGLAAMRRILDVVKLAPDEIEHAFDQVLGAPLLAINQARLAAPRPCSEVRFGPVPEAPDCSIIVPLYGRMDFMHYQLALMSAADMSQHEFLFVLDDPPRKQELLGLAEAAWNKFGIPFRVLALEENLGFAPANNVGLERARGRSICFLNSDVMPHEPRWLDLMLETLRADPGIGMVGALLLFEDGTVQHESMTYERLPSLGNWPFPMHPNKGMLPAPGGGVETVEAVTGACMVLSTELAREMGGFDEAFAVGDFEDSDLCFKIKRQGLRCVVDRRAVLWHLERQSQVTPDRMWRMYLTLQNAWIHTRRWFPQAE